MKNISKRNPLPGLIKGNLLIQGNVVFEWFEQRTFCCKGQKELMIDLYEDYVNWCNQANTSVLLLQKKTFAFILKKILHEEVLNYKIKFVYKTQSTVLGLKLKTK